MQKKCVAYGRLSVSDFIRMNFLKEVSLIVQKVTKKTRIIQKNDQAWPFFESIQDVT